MILVFTTSAGVPIVAATRPAHALEEAGKMEVDKILFCLVANLSKTTKNQGKSYLARM